MRRSNAPSDVPTEGWAEVGGLRINYLDWGGNGPPVIALHGLASSAHWYDLMAPNLRSQVRIIAPDQRGHGKTTQARNGYDWQTLASDIAGLMDWLGIERATVLGHSWGGNVASAIAAYYPNRMHRLVMIDGGFFDARLRPDARWERFKSKLAPRNVSGTRREFLERSRIELAECWNDDLKRIIQTMVYEDDQGQIQDILLAENHAQVLISMWEEPASTVLPRITCPTLIIPAGPNPKHAGAEFTKIREEMVEAATNALMDCRVHWIPETIHDIGYHKPEELARIIGRYIAEE